MDKSDLKEIRASRPTNIARMLCALIFFVIYYSHSYPLLLFFAFIHLSVALYWFYITETKYELYKSNSSLWYIPATIDVLFLSISVYITGLSYSPALLGYVFLTCMSSADLIRGRGLFSMFGSIISFLFFLILTKFGIIQYINIVNNTLTEITLFSSILSSLLLVIACSAANSVIYQIYYQLNEKNISLSSSLDKINILKLQQDADYSLAAKLMEPFSENTIKSKIIKFEFILNQKKTFTFKNEISEIGGDIILADEIYLNKKKYMVFMNGDAMGKSIQGACGALVLAVICKSQVTNVQNFNTQLGPDEWICNSMLEIHRIFESFDGFMLASIFLSLIEESTGKMYYINAEHPYPILYRDEHSSFLENENILSKVGTLGIDSNFNQVNFFQLIDGDALFIGSDGKDDLLLKSNDKKTNEMNTDEVLFSRIVSKNKGNLPNILKELKILGDFRDDLSLLKISFNTQPDK